ncbi:hypothetical protein BDV19DRAFT_367274 [Aspergillus venezuelensis]
MFNFASNFSQRLPPNQPSAPKTALQQACESGDLITIREAASTAEKDDLTAALHRACGDDTIAVIEILLDHPGSDVNAIFEGRSTLCVAAESCEPDVICLLLDPGARNDDGDTPLGIATRMEHQWAIDVLSRSQLWQDPRA